MSSRNLTSGGLKFNFSSQTNFLIYSNKISLCIVVRFIKDVHEITWSGSVINWYKYFIFSNTIFSYTSEEPFLVVLIRRISAYLIICYISELADLRLDPRYQLLHTTVCDCVHCFSPFPFKLLYILFTFLRLQQLSLESWLLLNIFRLVDWFRLVETPFLAYHSMAIVWWC